MARDESPPPAYNEHDPVNRDGDLERGVNQNVPSQTEALAPSARPVASSAIAPSRPAQIPPAPPRAASRPIPLRRIQKHRTTSSFSRSLAGSRADVARGVRSKYPFADPRNSASDVNNNAAGSAPSWWRDQWRKIKDCWPVLLLNIPLLVMIVMDIIGTYGMSNPAYYWNVVHSSAFHVIFISLGIITSAINLSLFAYTCSRGDPPSVTARRGCWRVWQILIYGLLIPLVTLGFSAWPFIEIFGVQRHIYPTYSCQELGFRSSILLEVLGGVSGASGMLQFPNNVTIRSGDEAFALSMSPTIQRWGDNDEFLLTPLSQTTTPTIFPRVAGYEATIFLSDKIHQFRYTASGANDTYVFKNGTFTDDPNYYLSFPNLSPPMYSTTKANWTYIGTRPWVELVIDRGTVLKTVRNQRGDKVNTMMRMCGAWTVADMVEDLNKMEGVLVGLARMMIELMKWGLDY